jgi:hypothetical protein
MERPFAIQIDADGAWEEEDWWHVPVWPDRDVPRTYMYYDVLAEAEVELQDVEDLNVILIPTAPKAPAVD